MVRASQHVSQWAATISSQELSIGMTRWIWSNDEAFATEDTPLQGIPKQLRLCNTMQYLQQGKIYQVCKQSLDWVSAAIYVTHRACQTIYLLRWKYHLAQFKGTGMVTITRLLHAPEHGLGKQFLTAGTRSWIANLIMTILSIRRSICTRKLQSRIGKTMVKGYLVQWLRLRKIYRMLCRTISNSRHVLHSVVARKIHIIMFGNTISVCGRDHL